MRKRIRSLGLLLLLALVNPLHAASYTIDTEGMHAFIHFSIPHLGYSNLIGRFNDFSGSFDYDPENPNASKIEVNIDTASIDSNHAERDKHLRDEDFLYVSKYPKATFVSTSYVADGPDSGTLTGNLTLRGVTRPVTIKVEKIGEGPDPWGGYRVGFTGTTTIALADFGITKFLGKKSTEVKMILDIEGVRQNDNPVH
ncbi:MAG: YceI family protein [Gammaproteobacteria bacterium]|jgi:polyisoprenoid-binding protein YceI